MPRLNQSGTLLEGIALWGELKPSAHARRRDRARAALLRPRGVARTSRHPQPCRHLRRPPARRRRAARGEAHESRPTSTCSSSPFRRTAITARQTPQRTSNAPSTRASMSSAASRTSSAPWRTARASVAALCAIAAEARPDGRHALRRERRPAVAPHRDAGRRDAAPAASPAASPARTSPPCTPWTTTTSRSSCR